MRSGKYNKHIWESLNISNYTSCEGPSIVRVRVDIIECYNQGHISDYLDMLHEIQKTFPGANERNVVCSVITESRIVKRGTILHYSPTLPENYRDMYDVSDYYIGSWENVEYRLAS